MLFLPESVYELRRALFKDFDRGTVTSERAFRRMLEVDPTDSVALIEVGRSRQKAGDLAGAEECFWRAIEAQPCSWGPYMELAGLLAGRPDQTALSQGLTELAFRKVLLDPEGIEDLKGNPPRFGFEGDEDLKDLSPTQQLELSAEALRGRRDLESAAVTARLRPYRLIHEIQETADLDAQFVDAIVGEGQSMVPLLVGVLRGWAQDFLPEDDEGTVETALALLGEIGDASVIPYLLEFTSRDRADLSGAAGWAFGRIIELHPADAARVIGEAAPGLDTQERMAVAEQLLRHPALDGSGSLFARLSENLNQISKQDLDMFFPVLLSAMVAGRGRPGLELARAAFRKNRDMLSRKTRGECEGLIEVLGAAARPDLPSPEPSRWTVYDICGGNATWEDPEEEDEDAEEDDTLPPQPVYRKFTPGRNDPCWCGSGKKYKKCHLDADQNEGRGDAPSRDAGRSGSALPGEFDGLRRKLGDFLAEAVPKSDSRRAWKEFFGDAAPEEKEFAALIDWMIHDWIAPCFGRTVIEEYLRRHGSGLTRRERELAESWSRSFAGLYEVQDVRVGSGIEVKDLVSDRVFFVHDVNLSKQVVRWDGLLARVVEGERGRELTGVGVTVPRQALEPLRAWMEEDRSRTGLPWPEYLKRNLPRINRRPSEIREAWIESLRLTNNDGEELLFSKAVYRVLDEPAVTGALRAFPEMSEDEDGTAYTWLKGPPGEEGRTILGSIRLAGDELVFECNSKARHKRGKEMLSKLAGSALRHLRDQHTSQQEMKRRALEEPRTEVSPKEEIPPEVRQRLLTDYMERHFAKWPDTGLPALDGRTPREAVKTAAGKRKVSAILRDFQNAEEHKRKEGEPYYDITRLRAELGLEE